MMLVFLGASSVFAAEWMPKDNLVEYYPSRDGVNVVLASESRNFSSCNGGRRFSIHKSHENYQVLADSLRMAFALKLPVKLVVINEEACAPRIDRAVVVHN